MPRETNTKLGSLHTRLDKVLLGDLKLDVDHPFIEWITDTLEESLRQKRLMWEANREAERRKAQ